MRQHIGSQHVHKRVRAFNRFDEGAKGRRASPALVDCRSDHWVGRSETWKRKNVIVWTDDGKGYQPQRTGERQKAKLHTCFNVPETPSGQSCRRQNRRQVASLRAAEFDGKREAESLTWPEAPLCQQRIGSSDASDLGISATRTRRQLSIPPTRDITETVITWFTLLSIQCGDERHVVGAGLVCAQLGTSSLERHRTELRTACRKNGPQEAASAVSCIAREF